MLQQKNAYDVAFMVGKHTGLVQELYNDKSVEGLARYENIQELLNSIKEFTETPDEEGEIQDKSLGSYLQQITLLTNVDNDKDGDADVVKLMTVHAAKGLEFKCVFVVGMEENLFPSSMALIDREGLEEERRLFYVAVTRAKERLWVTYSGSRYRFGSLVQNDPSRFIEEIPASRLDKAFTGTGNRGAGAQGNYSGAQRAREEPKGLEKLPSLKKLADQLASNRPSSQPAHTPVANFAADDMGGLQVGMNVVHQKFGPGKVLALEGGANNRMASIEFGAENGVKKLMLNYAKLMIVK